MDLTDAEVLGAWIDAIAESTFERQGVVAGDNLGTLEVEMVCFGGMSAGALVLAEVFVPALDPFGSVLLAILRTGDADISPIICELGE